MEKMLRQSLITNKLVVVGDSHVDMFTYFCIASCRIAGASAYGLGNPDSLTKSAEAMSGFLAAYDKYIPLICVGEVDCNSIAWSKPDPMKFVDDAVRNLARFISLRNRKFIVSSVILPPVDSYIGSRARPRVTSTKKQRTSLVKLFNINLKDMCDTLGHFFLDITTSTTGPDGFVDPKYIINPKDVHLSPIQMFDVIREKLDEAAGFYNNL
jgi:hypothetical protein